MLLDLTSNSTITKKLTKIKKTTTISLRQDKKVTIFQIAIKPILIPRGARRAALAPKNIKYESSKGAVSFLDLLGIQW